MKRPNLKAYEKKRDFAVTPEPPPRRAKTRSGAPTFMVHKHDARRLHYDLRLEIDGALASWAIPKGPSFDPKVRRLAVQTEDHPLEYGDFEGRIPEGEYGAGDSIVWDRGVYDTLPPGSASAMRKKGHVDFVLLGEKLKGRWHLVRTRGQGAKAQWILFKAKDEFASPTFDVVSERPESVKTGKRFTRGPAPAVVVATKGDPLSLLLRIWPPARPSKKLRPAAGANPLFEPWTKGLRALAAVSRGRVALQSEEGRDLAANHPNLVHALSRLAVTEVVIDGEIDPGGKTFVAHDLLWIDGRDERGQPLEQRREILTEVFPNRRPLSLVAQHASLAAATRALRGRKGARIAVKHRNAGYGVAGSWSWIDPADKAPSPRPLPARRERGKK